MISLNPNKAKGRRFSHKLELLFWWILRLLPIFVFLIYTFGASRSESLWSIVVEDGGDIVSTLFYPFELILSETFSFYPSAFFNSLISDVFGVDGVFPMIQIYGFGVFNYLSYCVCIEILRMMYEVIVFIPRLAHKWISNAIQDD